MVARIPLLCCLHILLNIRHVYVGRYLLVIRWSLFLIEMFDFNKPPLKALPINLGARLGIYKCHVFSATWVSITCRQLVIKLCLFIPNLIGFYV